MHYLMLIKIVRTCNDPYILRHPFVFPGCRCSCPLRNILHFGGNNNLEERIASFWFCITDNTKPKLPLLARVPSQILPASAEKCSLLPFIEVLQKHLWRKSFESPSRCQVMNLALEGKRETQCERQASELLVLGRPSLRSLPW